MSAVNATQGPQIAGVSTMEPPASIGRRVGAYVIDAVIAGLIGSVAAVGAVLLWLPLLAALGAGTSTKAAVQVSMLGLILALGGTVLSLAWTIIWALMQGGRGSVGMRLLKIRLIRRDLGTNIGFWRALGRMIVFGILASFIVGYFTPLFDRSGRRQGWHDMMVGAIMVDAPAFAEGLARAAALAAAPPEPEGPAPIEELNRDRAFGLPVARPTVPPLPGARGAGAGVAPAGSALPTAAVIADLPAHLAPRSGAPAPVPAPAPAGPGSAPGVTPMPGTIPASAPAPLAAAPQLELRWDDGTVVVVPQAAIFGRDPVASAEAARVTPKLTGALSLPVADDSRSLSKTHFGAGIDRGGAWIVDLHSTNGTVLHRQGIPPRPLVPGELTGVLPSDVAVFGSRQVTFGVVSG